MRPRAERKSLAGFGRLVALGLLLTASAAFVLSCASNSADPGTVIFLIPTMPTDLDPRIGVDAQSERIHSLLFSGLLERDEQMNLRGDLADRWENPDPLTYVFHLRQGVRFHDGRALTSADVKFTFDSIQNGSVSTLKRGAYRTISAIEAPDPGTVIFHLTEPNASLLWNLARPAIGIVPAGSDPYFAAEPIGTGPFRLVSSQQDDEVVIERNPDYFRTPPSVERVRFRVVPEAIVRALELRKGSADIEVGSLTPDMVAVFQRDRKFEVADAPGTNYSYLGVNFDDATMAHREVRQALAYATDRETIIRYLLRGQARVADGVLPPNSWAYEPNVTRYPYDPARAEQLLEAAGFPRRPGDGGMRLHIVLKTSTDEAARALGAALQDQWRRVGVDLELRSMELATLFDDINRASFQLYYLQLVGGNNDPEIFEYAFSSKRMPPNGINRGHYHNPGMDMALDQARVEPDMERRKELFGEVQRIVADDLPYLSLWFNDETSVHRPRIENMRLQPAGDYDFLGGIKLR